MNAFFTPHPRRGLVLVFVGIAVFLVGTLAHAVTGNASWRVLAGVGLLLKGAGWLLFARDGRQS
ncbi:hypothetical protein [Streptomyces endophytica]|uniref:DUF4175 domain-containing protein n=1 Tax=Streptomyces endophytica TaxID=2991496 RepID=A0ABY6PB38_9ACTN|nr:hypothetical protein [Streptomyces endophytica]UZJ31009.1 hypothetical protein OJ254_12490 [Streptomyces endophytica]